MEKSLNIIQTLAKLGKIFSTIVFVCSIVGAAGSLIGIISLSIFDQEILQIGSITIKGIIQNEAGATLGAMYAGMTISVILCCFEIVLSKKAQIYFKHELAAGTPFTLEGAREMKYLGILAIVFQIVSSILASIVHAVFTMIMGSAGDLNLEYGGSISLGIMFLILSVIFSYGAQMRGNVSELE